MNGGPVAAIAMILCAVSAVGIVAMIPAITTAGTCGNVRRALHLTATLVAFVVGAALAGTVVGANAEAYLAV